MAAYVKYEKFVEWLANKEIDFFGTTDTFKAALCSDAPVVATDTVLADTTQVANGNGYVTGGEDTQNDSTRSGGTVTETAVDIVWTGSGAGFGPFRYVVRYDDTHASDALINYWDYGSSISVGASETFTLDFGASVSTLA
jgi:hypothetical protein